MSIRVGVGMSKDSDPRKAGFEAVKSALDMAQSESVDLVIFFSSISMDQSEVLKGVRKGAGDQAGTVGCSDAGEITNGGAFRDGVGVMAIKSDTLKFSTGVGSNIQEDAIRAGESLFKDISAKSDDKLKAVIMFPDVLVGNGADVVRGVQNVAGEHFMIVGGAAGDDFNFKKTFGYLNDEIMSGSVVGLGLSGEFKTGVGVRHGWVPIGVPMKVTRSEGAVLYELDGKPAISIYEDYFGQKADNLRKEPLARMAITYPLGIKSPDLQEYLIRDPITVNDDGSITCAAEIPQGFEARLMIGSKDRAIDAAKDAANNLMGELASQNSKPAFVLMFNCIAREKLFGQKANDEINAVLEIIGFDTPLLGFYTYGEIAPIQSDNRSGDKIFSRFYNETMVLLGVGE